MFQREKCIGNGGKNFNNSTNDIDTLDVSIPFFLTNDSAIFLRKDDIFFSFSLSLYYICLFREEITERIEFLIFFFFRIVRNYVTYNNDDTLHDSFRSYLDRS